MADSRTILQVAFFLLFISFHGIDCGLYTKDDPMEILDNSTIKNRLYESQFVWVVEFYSSWCGHCHAFAPTWKRFAKEIKVWDKVVQIGAFDCAEDRNLDVCRAYEIESFPTIKFFDANLKNKSFAGTAFKGKKTVKNIRQSLVEVIESQNNLKNAPEFKPTDLHTIESFTTKRTTEKLLVLVFEKSNSFIGKELILDTSGCKKLKVRRILDSQGEIVEKYKVQEFPSLIIIDQHGAFKEVSKENRTRKGFLTALNRIEPILKETEEAEKMPQMHKNATKEQNGADVAHEVYMTDLVSSISFSLRREVPKMKVIKGEPLKALKDWVNLLLQCTPAEPFLSRYLAALDKWLHTSSHEKSVTSGEWLQYMDERQKFDSYLPVEVEWRGCQGSKAHYRGFPCSLWVLFHTMTVHCGTSFHSGLTGLETLQRIRGFIDFFFGCRYCRNHFVAMSSNLKNEVKTFDDAILWLWERHNRVNARLASDLSSDPKYPKVQFPPEELCKECRIPSSDENTIITSPGYGIPETKWNKRVVLEFLKKHYGPDNIRLRDKNPFTDAENEESDSVRKSSLSILLTGLGIDTADTSLCVIIYCVTMMIVLGFYFYLVKRRRRKEYKHIV